jgi:hypothetical protein
MAICVRIDLHQSIDQVFPFVSNLENLPLYDERILEVKKITEGSLAPGTTYHLLTRQFGLCMAAKLVFTDHDPANHRFAYRVISGPFPVETQYSLLSWENGTQLTVTREPQTHGIWKWLMPLIKLPARKKILTELSCLKTYLETHS